MMCGEVEPIKEDIPTDIDGFYKTLRPFKKYHGEGITRFAPYQVDIWNDRFAGCRTRHYIRSPGVGMTGLLLMETLNIVLTRETPINALVLASDRRAACRLRSRMQSMVEDSEYAKYLVGTKDESVDMTSQARRGTTRILLRDPRDTSDECVRSILFDSVVSFDPSSISRGHVLMLDVMESRFDPDVVERAMARVGSVLVMTKGTMVVAMVPRRPYYGLMERFPGINDLGPGEKSVVGDELVRRVPMSIAIDADVIEGCEGNLQEMKLMDKSVRDARYPVGMEVNRIVASPGRRAVRQN